jgi:hypothetical protein
MTPEQQGGLFPYDYCLHWAAGHHTWEGKDVYNRDKLALTMYEAGWLQNEGVLGLVTPPLGYVGLS